MAWSRPSAAYRSSSICEARSSSPAIAALRSARSASTEAGVSSRMASAHARRTSDNRPGSSTASTSSLTQSDDIAASCFRGNAAVAFNFRACTTRHPPPHGRRARTSLALNTGTARESARIRHGDCTIASRTAMRKEHRRGTRDLRDLHKCYLPALTNVRTGGCDDAGFLDTDVRPRLDRNARRTGAAVRAGRYALPDHAALRARARARSDAAHAGGLGRDRLRQARPAARVHARSAGRAADRPALRARPRSEEHTSELQS